MGISRPSAVLTLAGLFQVNLGDGRRGRRRLIAEKIRPPPAITRQLRRDFERDIQTGRERKEGGNAPRGPNATDNLGEDEDGTERERAVNVLPSDGNDLPTRFVYDSNGHVGFNHR